MSRSICILPLVFRRHGTKGEGPAISFRCTVPSGLSGRGLYLYPCAHAGRPASQTGRTAVPGYSLADKAPDLHSAPEARINLSYLIEFYRNFPDKGNFFLENLFFDKLAGGRTEAIIAGKTEGRFARNGRKGLICFRKKRREIFAL